MKEFTQYTPTEIIFGKEAEEKTAEYIKKYRGNKVIIIYGGSSAKKSGLLGRLEDQLDGAGIPHISVGGVKPNPRLGLAEEAVRQAIEFQADFVLAVGGGSVIDTAKAVAHGIANPDIPIWDFWLGKEKLQKTTPVGVVLTISAAGSETSDSAVITDEKNGKKKGLNTDLNRPVFAVMNPELTYTLPKKQLTCGIIDIMMHTMERYFTSVQGNELTDAFAEALLRVVIENGRKAYADQTDYDAMSEIMWAGSISHNGMTGLGGAKDFATHRIGHEIGGKFDSYHGETLTVVWGAWAEYTYRTDVERFARYGRNVWGIRDGSSEEIAKKAICATMDYFKEMDMPTTFTELGIGVRPEEDLTAMAASATAGDQITVGNFKVLHQDDIFKIYQMVNQ